MSKNNQAHTPSPTTGDRGRATRGAQAHRPRPSRRKGPSRGWVPDQHGAWMMVSIPAILGLVYGWSTPALTILIPLVIAWYTGYFCFFAAGLWIKAAAKRKPDFLTPVLVYGAVCLAAAVCVLAQRPILVIWAAAFGPLVVIAVYEAWKKRPRSLASGESTVVASALLLPVMVMAAGKPISEHLWAVTAVIGMYFCTSIPFVKTLIRNRGERAYFIGSVASHAVAVAVTAYVAAIGWIHWLAVVAMLCALARAWWMPVHAEKNDMRWPPKKIGRIEIVFTVLVLIGVVLPPGLGL
ncbi:YwiC-like family protein [Corynebacterium mendelii]|uniref:YwiC-like family protein n=1 Tax=Corynebacterium mendelii TaxID=2765362 RepID=A0A939E0C0_9CORY|nr:YwiC-like family protein [Corynebacterium mendelii]MBN9644126.1 YwiC-like family protein [Corynebacterium mendelii]